MGTVGNIKIEPMNVTWGANTIQVQTVSVVADVSSSLNNKYFYIYNTSGSKFHVWYNVAAAGADPAPGGSTAVVVAISANATAGTVATATASAIDALTDFVSTASASIVTVSGAAAGYQTPATEGVGTTFAFAVTTEGDTAADIGYVDGDIEATTSEDLVDVTAHQTGTDVKTQLRTGKQVEVKLTFKETTVAQLSKLVRQGGSTYTPPGASGTEVSAWGIYKNFGSTILNAKKLTLHPVALGAADRSRDLTYWKAYAQLDTLTFSGENIFNIPVTFKIYPDESLNTRVQYFVYGDGTQTFT